MSLHSRDQIQSAFKESMWQLARMQGSITLPDRNLIVKVIQSKIPQSSHPPIFAELADIEFH
jgi:hypothetical protein